MFLFICFITYTVKIKSYIHAYIFQEKVTFEGKRAFFDKKFSWIILKIAEFPENNWDTPVSFALSAYKTEILLYKNAKNQR